jgi:hypothetical protein
MSDQCPRCQRLTWRFASAESPYCIGAATQDCADATVARLESRLATAERIAREALDLAGEIHAAIVNGEAKYRAEWDYREDRMREELDGGKP